MKRTKRHTIRRIALGLAVAAVVPATAQARPMDVSGSDLRAVHAEALANSQQRQSTVEIPYLSHGVGVTAADLGIGASKTPDDRAFSRQSQPAAEKSVEIPYLSHGVGVTAGDLGFAAEGSAQPRVEIPYLSHGVGFSAADLGVSRTSDDRPFSKATSVGAPSVSAAGDGSGIDVGTGTVSGIILLLAAAGAGLVVHHSRKAKLSPA